MEKIIISTENAPKAIGPYSQAVRIGNLVFLSGQLGMDPKTGEIQGDVAIQTRQALDNIGAVLSAMGLTFDHVVKTTVFVKDLDDFATVNEIYGSVFSHDAPARSCRSESTPQTRTRRNRMHCRLPRIIVCCQLLPVVFPFAPARRICLCRSW